MTGGARRTPPKSSPTTGAGQRFVATSLSPFRWTASIDARLWHPACEIKSRYERRRGCGPNRKPRTFHVGSYCAKRRISAARAARERSLPGLFERQFSGRVRHNGDSFQFLQSQNILPGRGRARVHRETQRPEPFRRGPAYARLPDGTDGWLRYAPCVPNGAPAVGLRRVDVVSRGAQPSRRRR